jgi:hypothetical protein
MRLISFSVKSSYSNFYLSSSRLIKKAFELKHIHTLYIAMRCVPIDMLLRNSDKTIQLLRFLICHTLYIVV